MTLGIALGFVTTPFLVTDHEDVSLIGQDLSLLFWIIAICSTIATALVIIFFDKEPKLPPSLAQALLRQNRGETKKKSDTIQSYKRLLRNGPFVCLLVTYGINMGTCCYLSTLLNTIILSHFPVSLLYLKLLSLTSCILVFQGGEQFAGTLGLIFFASGVVSCSFFGKILDKTRAYK